MAKVIMTAEEALDAQCREQFDAAMRHGDFQQAEYIKEKCAYEMDKLRKCAQMSNKYQNPYQNVANQVAQNAAMAQQMSNVNGALTSGIAGLNQSRHSVRSHPPKLGVLLLEGGQEVPEDWRGAEITEVRRAMYDEKHWWCSFSSKWGGPSITLYLSSDEYSGKEADKMAEIFKEVLNQRRMG